VVAVSSQKNWTSSDDDGRFIFDRVRAGEYTVLVRTMDGGESEAVEQMPGTTGDLVLGSGKKSGGKSRPSR